MTRYLLQRGIGILLTLFVVLTLMFFLSRLSGDPVRLMLPTNATDEQVQLLRERLGLDKSYLTQYWIFMSGVIARGDFGFSFRLGRPALQLVLERIPATVRLASLALLIACVAAIPLGILAGLRPGGVVDFTTQAAAVLGQSLPTFWIGLLLIILFSVRLGWFPVIAGYGIRAMVLPSITLSLSTAALVARMLRASIQDVAGADYVRTARAKGLPERSILVKHILRNSLIPVVAVLMLQLSALMGGAVVTETVFAYPGMGLLAVQAILARDYAVVQTFVFFCAVVVCAANLVADLIYAALDPRIRYE